MRLGEVLALKWGDIQFGTETDGGNRFIYVRRNWVDGQFGKPKSGKERRVDLSKQLRRALAELRDKRMLAANLAGKTSVADELAFPSEAGTPLNPGHSGSSRASRAECECRLGGWFGRRRADGTICNPPRNKKPKRRATRVLK
jgi:integrase